MTCQMTMSLGVYVLGAADAGERRRLEEHLPGCPECQAELWGLAPLPGLLAGVPDDMLAAGRPSGRASGQPSGRAPGQLAPARAHGRSGRPRWAAAAVCMALAACVVAAAGAFAGFWRAPADTAQRPAPVVLTGANPALHMSATATLTATSWGTSIHLRLRGLPLNVPCRLIVRSRTGVTEVSGIWDAWRDGPISVPASADVRPSGIASLQVATATRDLLTLSAGQRLISRT